MRKSVALMAAVGAFCALSSSARSQTYKYYDLGASYYAYGINPGATVVNGTVTWIAGTDTVASSPDEAFYIPITWSVSGTTYTPTIGTQVLLHSTLNPIGSTDEGSEATGVNDSGNVCGYYSYTGSGTVTNQGFVVTAGATPSVYALMKTPAGSELTFAYAINKNNDVAGWDDQMNIAYYWTPGSTYITSVSSPSTVPTAAKFFAVNDSEVYAGFANFYGTGQGQDEVAGTYTGSTWTELTAAGSQSMALGINDSGQVCGTSSGEIWRYSSSTLTQIGTSSDDPGAAYGINGAGYVVGEFTSTSSPSSHAFVSPSGSTLTDLNSTTVVTNLPSGTVLEYAYAIDYRNGTKGDIVGVSAVGPRGTKHGFLLVQN